MFKQLFLLLILSQSNLGLLFPMHLCIALLDQCMCCRACQNLGRYCSKLVYLCLESCAFL